MTYLPQNRNVPAAADGVDINSGVAHCFRFTVSTGGTTLTIPTTVRYAVLRNAGAFSLRFNFAGDSASDYFTLGVADRSPDGIAIGPGQVVTMQAVGTNTTAEVVTWS